ncbi:MAG: hypothetical protein JXK94_14990 [Deltaproteobacteria bacterium]|nr:hypothetical protein [Deltaproteobacteria bacterium]
MILAVLVSMALAAPVLAATPFDAWDGADGSIGGTTGTLEVSLSPGCHIDYNNPSADGANYTMLTVNQNGTRVYGTQFNFEGIIMSDTEQDFTSTDFTAPTAPALGDWASGWTVMGGSSADLPTT